MDNTKVSMERAMSTDTYKDEAKLMRGRHSTVFITGDTVIKIFPQSLFQNFWKEVKYLSMLQSSGFVPKLYEFNALNLEIKMEYVRGVIIKKWINTADYDEIIDVLRSCMDICRKLDEMRIQKEEMNHPDKHIIVQPGRIVFIDFERAHSSVHPKNVTQFLMYLSKIGIVRISPDIIEKMREYKRKLDSRSYMMLKKSIFPKAGEG